MSHNQSATEGSVQEFHPRVHEAITNPQIRANFRKAMDGLMDKRQLAFPSDDELQRTRELAAAIRLRALSKLPELLEKLEANLTANGVKVHWAENGDEACKIILDICNEKNAKSVIKGKSMVSEEMELNHYLEEHGIEALESDLGEYIVQLAEETPSHIIMPAIHKNTDQISDLMHEKTGTNKSRDVEYLTAEARQQLRERFEKADVGVSGVNFAVAETGTLCLVENEGNGRLTTTVPPVHIAVTGIEKVVENMEDVAPLLSILTRSATGQHITTYFNMISSPRKEGELDGPEEVHLVLVDSGRSNIYQDDELLDTLRCIRCGACMNHCPVYTRIGGHAYGHTYPGPIGSILMPHLVGMDDAKDLPSASSLCGACGEVCPVKIPIPKLLVRLREESVAGDKDHDDSTIKGRGIKRKGMEPLIWKGWAKMHKHGGLYRTGTGLATVMWRLIPSSLLNKSMGAWTNCRTKPKLAATTLHQQMKARQQKSVSEGNKQENGGDQ